MTGARGFEILAWQVCQEMGLRGRCGYCRSRKGPATYHSRKGPATYQGTERE